MKKLGLCVRYDCNNFGSMLQIFATQKAIERCNWKYEIIRYDKKTLGFLVKNVFRLFNPYFMKGKLISKRKEVCLNSHPEIKRRNSARLSLFKEYREQYLGPYSMVYKGYGNLQKGALDYDAIMVGSDQLWTPAGIKTGFYNLLFVPEDIKKISLATSFGVTEIPNNQRELTKKYLERINCLSVREQSGATLVEKLIGVKPFVAVDPTLLFTRKEWDTFFENAAPSEEPYIFAYFLGTNPKHRELVSKFAKEKNLKVLTCPFMDEFVQEDIMFGDEQRFEVSPIDFLNLIRNAEYVFTDSFHGSVFSILYNKSFLTFDRYSDKIRKSKNTRIDSLFSQLGLEKRHVSDSTDSLVDLVDEPVDYIAVEENLSRIRRESFAFLDKALNEG